MSLLNIILDDIRSKARRRYSDIRFRSLLKVLVSDGTAAMIYYRLMQWSRKYRLSPLEMLFNRMNTIFCNCIVGRSAEFGPRFVLLHSTGTVINGRVRGGSDIYLEHQVTIGAEDGQNPLLGSNIYIGAGAKLFGDINIGDGAKIGANAVVLQNVPPNATAVGIPARIINRNAEKLINAE